MVVASTKPRRGLLLASAAVGRKVDADDLVSAIEIAARLGSSRPQLVYDWRRRYSDFPQPIAQVGRVHIWVWPDVEKWARNTGRL